MSTECPVPGCSYNENLREFREAMDKPLNLATTRSNASVDAHRDMDGYDENEELARARRAVSEAEHINPADNPDLYKFIVEAFRNIDESLRRLGPLPRSWSRSVRK